MPMMNFFYIYLDSWLNIRKRACDKWYGNIRWYGIATPDRARVTYKLKIDSGSIRNCQFLFLAVFLEEIKLAFDCARQVAR